MKRNCLVLIFLFMLLLTVGAFAQNDITIKFNGGNSVWYGNDNTMELWFQNDQELTGMSLGFQFTSTVPGYSWKTPHGTIPGGTPYVQAFGDAIGAFDFGVLFTSTQLPSKMLFGGASNLVNLPVHALSTKCYDVVLVMPAAVEPQTFTVAPYFFPPAGAWKLVGVVNTAIAPSLNGHVVNVSTPSNPTVEGGPIPFPIVIKPCGAPVFTNGPGATATANQGGFSYDFDATVGEVAPLSFSVAPPATINAGTGQLFVPAQCPAIGTTAVVVHATNGCPATTDYSFVITWTNDAPVITNCPAAPLSITSGSALTRTFTATDDGTGLVWSGDDITAGGAFSFTPPAAGLYNKSVTVTDACGLTATCNFTIDAKSYNIVQIAKTGEQYGVKDILDPSGPVDQDPGFVYQGTYAHVKVRLSSDELQLAGYNLLIHYDASALSFVSAEIGYPLRACTDHQGAKGWEYFTYRFGADGNCGGPCPTGLLRVVALAETNNGPFHPGCGGPDANTYNLKGEIADLKFYVTNDRTFECQYSEIGFAWIDCSDNSFSDPTGNILYIAADKAVHTFEWQMLNVDLNLLPCEAYPNMTGVVIGGFCPGECANIDPNKPQPIEFMYFMNGGVDIACADSIDARGDINLNGVAYEIADAVLFTNFFIKGISAFDPDPQKRQGMVAATDVNNDGKVLTVGDLVYLMRIIVNDAQPIQKLSPFASAATVNFANGSVSTESGSEIGGVYATFAIDGAYNVTSNTDMSVEYGEVNGELKVLVFSGLTNLSNRIASGTNELFTVSGNVELKSVEVADYAGNMLNTRVNKSALPTSFALSQNVPNPFNPTTKIGFALPNQSQWTLSIYNVAGQLVKNFSGNNIGSVSVEWDASMVPSGVYFYKLNAGSYSDTKKMVLMK